MLSWVFRHRARLRVIYGLAPAEGLVPCLPAAKVVESEPNEQGEAGDKRLAPGHWARRSRYVVLRPMPAHAV